ncbi:MAG: hypothetical protein PHF56_24040 [Desulfuromonadaceae bacterium]|nr:hypothetical protein [Desulfuromonadaceae bacterium]
MEPITLCGLVIVAFGLWLELEPSVMAVVKIISKSKFITEVVLNSTVQAPVYVRKMPVCVAKVSPH